MQEVQSSEVADGQYSEPLTVDPFKERNRIKNLIRKGVLPTYKVERVKVKTGTHPSQHRMEWRLVSTLALLTQIKLATGPEAAPIKAVVEVQCSKCCGLGGVLRAKGPNRPRLRKCKACDTLWIRS